MPEPPRFDPDLEWLDLVRPVGLVVAPSLLKGLGLTPELQTRADNAAVAELLRLEDEEGPVLSDAWTFAERILSWPKARVAGAPGGPALPEGDLCKVLREHDTVLEPHWAVAGVDGGWQVLVRIEAPGIKPDARGALAGWEATPHQRFERLLRETQVPIGVLITDNELRLVYAPSRETSGWIAFPLRPLATVAGRPMLGGLKLVLDRVRLFTDAEPRRLPAVLKASRDAQTTVSTTLAEQVVGALHELLRGLTAAEPKLIGALATEQSPHLYEGLLTVLMRLVFILYAEDRDLIPSRTDEKARALYEQGYSVRGLHAKLLDDQARYPDTLEERRGAWGRLIALFRLIHAGDRTGWIRARGGKLFNPDAFPFLEGRASPEDPPRITYVTDGCVLRILDGLLTLKGERLSYRTLDVEQIGSVYETVMGFTVLAASGPVLAIRAGKHNRTPVFVDLAELSALRSEERLKRLKDDAQRSSLTERQQREIRAAADVEGMAAALDSIVDERGSPDKRILAAGTPILQPTAERRSTGSHYTPRSLTEPIVRHALEPVFERLGPEARPEEVLDAKVCDPAMGSGAFLVEACRALAARLVQAWVRWPETRPKLPADEDDDLHARRLVAQRCLYGVDKNPMATDLAKLSLWLATLAREHEFTFLDHALKSGDSLVGLTRAQIAAVHWDSSKPGLPLFRDLIRERFEAALTGRAEIRDAPDDVERAIQEARYQRIEQRLSDARVLGDAVIAAFFSADKSRAREAKRQEIESWLNEPPAAMWMKVSGLAAMLRQGERAIPPFHWELEYPEVFGRENRGFDVIVGNPPFAGKNTISANHRKGYSEWLQATHPGAHGNADLVAHFFLRMFRLLRDLGVFGLVATNTIAQGDTRQTGLRPILGSGGEILRATRRLPWPGDAAVVVAVVHVVKGTARSHILDGRRRRRISAYLVEGDLDDAPAMLRSNTGKAFQGSIILGAGFTFDDRAAAKGLASTLSEMQRLIRANPANRERISPYIGGDEIASDPEHRHHRYVIDFADLSEVECRRRWPDLMEIVERLVKGARAAHSTAPWWLFERRRPELYAAIAGLPYVLVNASKATPHHALAVIPNGMVYSQNLNVFAFSQMAMFTLLSSRIREVIARFLGTTMKDDFAYGVENCFETFPFPEGSKADWGLEVVGQVYHSHRAALMIARNEGMTQTYNRFRNPRETALGTIRLRELHAEMDRAVLRAYSWDDLAERAEPHFLDETNEDDHKYQGRLFWPAVFRDEVLARLLALNGERAAAERENEPLALRPRAKRAAKGQAEAELLERVAANEDD
jgi:hypothetical protein